MKTSIATVCLSGDLSAKLAAAGAAGFDAVEIFENDFLAFDRGPDEVARMVRDAGLTVSLFQPFRDFEGLPEPQRGRAFERAMRKFDVMQALGTDLILICSSVSPLAQGGIDRAADDLRELGERAAERGLRIGYEALAWGRFVSDHRDAWEIVRRADHPNVGVILDSFHTLARGIDPASIRAIPKDRIFFVQLADAPRLDLDLLSWSRHYRNMPGQGELAVGAFAEAVAATGYDGVWSLEIFNDQFRAGSAREVALDGRRSLLLLEDGLRKAAGSAQRLPPKAATNGVSFVEFAADEGSATPIVALAESLGFARVGTHRSKSVALFAQGPLRLVVNTEAEGFAHSSFVLRGANVCALGLRVPGVEETLARAEALLAPTFREPRGKEEYDLPALRGVGGSLLYLIDAQAAERAQWEADFELAPGWDRAEGIGLIAVDHLAQTMREEELLSWMLFYESLFDLSRRPPVEVADPGGLVRSQVLEGGDGSLRIVLNASQSGRTLSGRFMRGFVGPGVHHIAFAARDILETARRLADAGTTVLRIPGNYYDDLDARFDLPPATLSALREHSILYDRDEAGEYFQLYLPPLDNGFFVEIVERRGYRGLGAVNAPIRLAAQARLRPEGLPTLSPDAASFS